MDCEARRAYEIKHPHETLPMQEVEVMGFRENREAALAVLLYIDHRLVREI